MDTKTKLVEMLTRIGMYSQIHSPLRAILIEELADMFIAEGVTFK